MRVLETERLVLRHLVARDAEFILELVNEPAFIRNIGDWFFLGVRDTTHWGFWLHDVTNQYVLQGVRGGFVTMMLFLTLTVFAYYGLTRVVRQYPDRSRPQRVAWCIGAAVFAHMVMFLAVSYFGQITFLWTLMLALCGSLTPVATARPDGVR